MPSSAGRARFQLCGKVSVPRGFIPANVGRGRIARTRKGKGRREIRNRVVHFDPVRNSAYRRRGRASTVTSNSPENIIRGRNSPPPERPRATHASEIPGRGSEYESNGNFAAEFANVRPGPFTGWRVQIQHTPGRDGEFGRGEVARRKGERPAALRPRILELCDKRRVPLPHNRAATVGRSRSLRRQTRHAIVKTGKCTVYSANRL